MLESTANAGQDPLFKLSTIITDQVAVDYMNPDGKSKNVSKSGEKDKTVETKNKHFNANNDMPRQRSNRDWQERKDCVGD